MTAFRLRRRSVRRRLRALVFALAGMLGPVGALPALAQDAALPYAYVDIQRVLAESNLGRAAAAELTALQARRVQDLNERRLAQQTLKQRLEAGAGVMTDAAVAQASRDIERRQLEIQRLAEDAQAELQALQNERLAGIENVLRPVLVQMFEERRLLLLLDAATPGLLIADPSLDLTTEVIDRLNGSTAAFPTDS